MIATATAKVDGTHGSGEVDRVDWLRDPSALQSIEEPWRALESRVQQRSHVSTFDFLHAWYRHYAGAYGGTPLIGLAWRGSDLIGVAPLTIRRGRLGRMPVTRIDFAPTDAIAGEFLVDDYQPGVITSFIDTLVHSRTTFDVICLNGFDPASAQLPALRHAAARHHLAIQTEDHACAVVDLRKGYEAYHDSLSAHYRRNLNQKARRIAATGFTIEGVQQTRGLETLEACIPRIIAINEASYKLEGQPLADRHRGFLADVVRRFGARGMLSLPILSIGGRDAAFILGVLERGYFYDITLAYDEAFARLSPGAFLMQEALRHLASVGVHTWCPTAPTSTQETLVERVHSSEAGVSLRGGPEGDRDACYSIRTATAVEAAGDEGARRCWMVLILTDPAPSPDRKTESR